MIIFLTGLVVRLLSDQRVRNGLIWAFWIIVAIIVLPMLNRGGWIALGVILGILTVLAVIVGIVEGIQQQRRSRELLKKLAEEARWPRVRNVGRATHDGDHRWYWPVTLSCGHTGYGYGAKPEVGRRVPCSWCKTPDGPAHERQDGLARREALRNLRALR